MPYGDQMRMRQRKIAMVASSLTQWLHLYLLITAYLVFFASISGEVKAVAVMIFGMMYTNVKSHEIRAHVGLYIAHYAFRPCVTNKGGDKGHGED
jgi:hypothetical protein